MRKSKLLVGVLSTALVLGGMTLPGVSVGDTVTAEATGAEYHAYLVFQTSSYSFRNAWDDSYYGLNGSYNTEDITYYTVHAWDGSDLVSAAGTFVDATIIGDGTYTVSVSGLDWTEDEFSNSDTYNLIGVSTDIAWDEADITVDEVIIGDTIFEDPDIYNAGIDGDADYVLAYVEDIWADTSLGEYDATSSSDISITFTISNLAATSGTCGENLTWELDTDGTLTISGTGDMYEYSWTEDAPWEDLCENVTSIVVSDGVTNIAYGAFSGCTNATSVDIAGTVTSIGDVAFSNCSSLTSVDIPSGVTNIGYQAFSGCTSLTDVTIADTVTTIDGYAFDHCTSLGSIEIPEGVTSIGMATFNFCTSLQSLNIPASVTDLGDAVAQFCTSLESVTVDENSESYVSVDDIIYTKDMTTLVYCMTTKEGDVVVPDTVTTIEGYSFVDCEGITSIGIPDMVSEIKTLAFFDCTGLTELDLPDSITYLAAGLLAGCSGITSIEIPENVTSINYDAFSSCSSLTTIWMSTNVTEIASAFYGCSALTDVYYSGTQTEWDAISISLEENYYFTSANIHFNGSDYILGDVNLDGEINYLDAMMVLRYDAALITLTDEKMTVGDVNKDGEVNSLDAIKILRYDAGLITSF